MPGRVSASASRSRPERAIATNSCISAPAGSRPEYGCRALGPWAIFDDDLRDAEGPDFMRIVGGRLAGRDLVSPNDFRVRPTAEPVRAELLAALAGEVEGARVLDLFAGTGALGLEALSRGARSADFVEFRPASLHALRANVAALGLRRQTRIFKRDAIPFAEALGPDGYDLAFADPPYGSRILDRVLKAWRERRFARVFAVEHDPAHDLPAGARRLDFPETAVTIYRL